MGKGGRMHKGEDGWIFEPWMRIIHFSIWYKRIDDIYTIFLLDYSLINKIVIIVALIYTKEVR